MIVFDLHCGAGHRFEGWFASSAEFAAQQHRGLISCPQCGADDVSKAPMAPAVPAKGNRKATLDTPIPAEVMRAMQALAQAQSKALANSRWVGDGFAEETRAMHYGDKDLEQIHGEATLEEARSLLDEGIEVAPLLVPIAEPDQLN